MSKAKPARLGKTPPTYGEIPRVWDELVKLHPLRPIHDDVELGNATELIDMLAGHDLNPDQDDYLDALSTLVEAYESDHHPVDVSHVRGLEALRYLLAEHGMTAADLARLLGVHRSHAAKILKGERSLTAGHLKMLSEHFRVSANVFIR